MIPTLTIQTHRRMPRSRALRAILPALTVLALASGAQADQLSICEPSAGPVVYYVLDGVFGDTEVPPHATLFEFHHGTAFFTDDTRHERIVHERGARLIEAVCLRDIATIQDRFGIHAYTYLGGELFAVWQFNSALWTWKRLGTAWVDFQSPFATGGSIGLQEYYVCPFEMLTPYLNDSGAWHTGLDRAAMGAPSEDVRETEYFSRVRGLLQRVAHAHMMANGCEPMSQQQWLGEFGPDVEYGIHYDVYDPSYGVVDEIP